MACDSEKTIQVMIESDRHYISSCKWIYGVVLAASVVLVICLEKYVLRTNILASLSGLLANGLVFPLVPKHMQRAGAVRVMHGLQQECRQHDPNDPGCKRIADNVDTMLRARGGI
jgi:hypothetical protein